MRREKKQELKAKLIAKTYEFIAEGHILTETEEMAERLCKFYFPYADCVFVESFRKLAYNMQNKYWQEDIFNSLVREYKGVKNEI